MAAYAALVSLENIIHDIQHHHSPPISFDNQQAQSLTQTIASLQQFLESYNSSEIDDEADPLEMRIADAAYAAEDVIESHIVNRILPPGSQHRLNRIIKYFNCFRALKKAENIPFSEASTHHDDDQTNLYEDLQQVIEEMESIKKLTEEIGAEKVVVHHQRARSVDASAAPSKSFSTRQNSIVVCSEDVINEVMEKLARGKPDRHVIPIAGMGGIGKTTLAKNIYEKPFIKEHFQIRAWATISQQYNTKEILCEVLSKATKKEKENLGEKSEDELGTELHQYLFGRKYLIVLDDMWSIDAWDKIQRFLPNNENGSRVLVTTRLSQLGSQLNESYTHDMKFLDEGSSWDLFSKTVFGEEISCPSELEGIGKKIVENCRGLPLSIVVVGGILKNAEHTRGCWESIGKNLTSIVNLENDKHCLRLLRMSYNHLPAYLKPCFLYMGVFEEDSQIKVSTLIKLWVGEGFLKHMNNESLKAIGKWFFKDLVYRNLILIHEFGSMGNVKYCKIHDLLRDFCLNESKKDEFYHVIGDDSPRGISRQRRLVIPRKTSKKKVLHDLRSMSHVRSVISEYGRVPSCQSLRLMRALHAYKFRYFDDESYVNSHAFQYVNLRHLAVEVNKTSSFFSSINLYWNLHSLIVACTHNSTAPVDIWKMPQFRRIEFVNRRFFLPDPPSDAVVMENLEILKKVENFKFGERVVERIPNIKKLELRYSGSEGIEHEDYYCLSNIQLLHKLESLEVSLWVDFRKVESLNKLTFPHSLKKLNLSVIPKFEFNDILEMIGSLPLLEKLKLSMGGFRRGEWEIGEGQFPCLKYLEITSSDLRKLTKQDESSNIFPSLVQLHLENLEELEEIPYEIGEIATLLIIQVRRCGASVVKRAKEIVVEQMESQGDDLSFDVLVELASENEELQSLAGPNFEFPEVKHGGDYSIYADYVRYLRLCSENQS